MRYANGVHRNQPLTRILFKQVFFHVVFEEELCIWEALFNVFVSLLVNWATNKANDP